jgi:hypothetical protein
MDPQRARLVKAGAAGAAGNQQQDATALAGYGGADARDRQGDLLPGRMLVVQRDAKGRALLPGIQHVPGSGWHVPHTGCGVAATDPDADVDTSEADHVPIAAVVATSTSKDFRMAQASRNRAMRPILLPQHCAVGLAPSESAFGRRRQPDHAFWARTTTTGQVAWWTEYWPTEPSSDSVMPVWPRFPTTSSEASLAALTRTWAAWPSVTC